MNKQPTDAQAKEFWEWCGFELDAEDFPMVPPVWEYPKGIFRKKLPPIDLNNLFKYAVPKVGDIEIESRDGNYDCWIYENRVIATIKGYGEGKDPALALFWAIWEVIHNDTG